MPRFYIASSLPKTVETYLVSFKKGVSVRRLSIVPAIFAAVALVISSPTVALAETTNSSSFVIDLNLLPNSSLARSGTMYTLEESQGLGAERFQLITDKKGRAGLVTQQYVPVLEESPEDYELQGDVVLGITDEDPGPYEETGGSTVLSEDPTDWEMSFMYGRTDTTASFLWERAVGEYFLTTQSGEQFASRGQQIVLEQLKPGTDYSVSLVGDVRNGAGEIVRSERLVNFSTLASNELRQLRSGGDSIITPLVYQNVSTQVTYRTFIPEAAAPGAMCNWGNSAWTFDGDNRSWSVPNSGEPMNAPSSRTIMMVASNWMSPIGNRLYTYKKVGASISRKNNVVQSTSYASMDKMLFQNKSESAGYTQVRLNHAAANPHCSLFDVNYGGAIQYNVMVRLYQSGTVDIDGYRRPVPNHEVYAGLDKAPVGNTITKQYMTMYRGTNKGFGCLIAGLCADELVHKTVSN